MVFLNLKFNYIHILASAIFSLISTIVHAAGPNSIVRVGNWYGGSYTSDQTGAFSHCAASTPYNSGIEFFVSINNLGLA